MFRLVNDYYDIKSILQSSVDHKWKIDKKGLFKSFKKTYKYLEAISKSFLMLEKFYLKSKSLLASVKLFRKFGLVPKLRSISRLVPLPPIS